MKTTRTVSIDAGHHRARVRNRRNELVEQHLSLVEGIARGVHRSLPPCFDLDDLIGVGNVALVHAATTYRPEAHSGVPFAAWDGRLGVPFAAWARQKVRGAILDSVRRGKRREATMAGLVEHPRQFQEEWIPGECPFTGTLDRAATQPVVDARIDEARQTLRLAEAISWLPAAQQRVLSGYYAAHEPTLAEVAATLGVPLARARALRSAAVEGLRARFKRVA